MIRLLGCCAFLALMVLHPVKGKAEPAPLTDAQHGVFGCIGDMENGTAWSACLELMFAPCDGAAVGSEDHLACLQSERESWLDTMQAQRTLLHPLLTPDAGAEFFGLMSQWYEHVIETCDAVAADPSKPSAAAAGLGCEITEIVGATREIHACRTGSSAAQFCVLRQ